MKTEGTVQQVSDNGDLITTITARQLADYPRDSQLRVVVDDEHETFGVFDSPEGQPAMTLLAIQNGEDVLRLHLVGDSAAAMLGIRAGAKVVVQS
jgi:hypothetical protein